MLVESEPSCKANNDGGSQIKLFQEIIPPLNSLQTQPDFFLILTKALVKFCLPRGLAYSPQTF